MSMQIWNDRRSKYLTTISSMMFLAQWALAVEKSKY